MRKRDLCGRRLRFERGWRCGCHREVLGVGQHVCGSTLVLLRHTSIYPREITEPEWEYLTRLPDASRKVMNS